MKKFLDSLFAKLRKPHVTKCCSYPKWCETTGGTFCYNCKQIIPNNLRQLTNEDMKDNNLTEKEFNEM